VHEVPSGDENVKNKLKRGADTLFIFTFAFLIVRKTGPIAVINLYRKDKYFLSTLFGRHKTNR